MQKRKIIFDTYDTAADGLWTLASCVLGDAEPVTTLLDIPGRLDGPLDASEALTGDIQYGPRPLEVTLESSEGTRLERKARIDYMVNLLHGRRVPVWLPDDPGHYVIGRLSVRPQYNDLAHAAVQVSATCEPWRYATEETEVTVEVGGSHKDITLTNDRRKVYPTATVVGEIEVTDEKGHSFALGEGTHLLTGLPLGLGNHVVTVFGMGSVTFTYRRAVL
jgi:hypothetical protein